MRRFVRTYADPALARKVAVVRGASVLLFLAFTFWFARTASSGAVGITNSSRSRSPAVSHILTWDEAPISFLFHLLVEYTVGVAYIGAVYFVLASAIVKLHGRLPFFRRNLPS